MCNLQGLLRSSNMRVLQQSHVEIDDDIESTEISVVGEPSSACLWAMVNDFLEVDTPAVAGLHEGDSILRSGSFLSANSSDAILKRAIQEMESIIGSSGHDVVAEKVASCVAKALNAKSSVVGNIESTHNERALPVVLKHLQREGYDVGLCATARKPCNALRFPPTGGHRYIDVVMEEMPVSDTLVGKRSSERLIVDVGFCAHFEIARPLPAYQKLIGMLPSTFIGKTALLQRVVRIMSQAARASLESQDMPIPPWRSFSFLLAKWFSPSCTRITSFDEAKNIVLNTSSSAANHINPCVLAELDYNSDLTNLTHPPVNDDAKINGPKSFFWQEGAAKPWYPPPSTNQISINDNDSYDNISSYTKKRRQANVVSALALAFGETRRTHMLTECVPDSAVKVCVQ